MGIIKKAKHMARILLAEDDDNLREFLTRGLRRAGHTVLPAADGDSALNLLIDDDSVDLLLADVVMPGLDGIELARQATKRWPTLRVMFITGFAAVALRQREMGSRPATVLAKPFHLRQLVEEVERMLAA